MSTKEGDARGYRLCAAQSILGRDLRLVFRYSALLRSRTFIIQVLSFILFFRVLEKMLSYLFILVVAPVFFSSVLFF